MAAVDFLMSLHLSATVVAKSGLNTSTLATVGLEGLNLALKGVIDALSLIDRVVPIFGACD